MGSEILTVDLDTVAFLEEAGGETFRLCEQCGVCISSCPWNKVRQFDIRRLMRQAQLGLVDFGDEAWWLCATCRACVQRCPQGVDIINIMRALRRGDWARDLNVNSFTADKELLYFSCCIPAYDLKVKRAAQSLVGVFNKARVNFGILGSVEKCCGESVRKAGNEALFRNLAQANISAFKEQGVRRVVVSFPHCYHAFKNEYADLEGNFEIIHYTQYLAQLSRGERLKFDKELKKKVAYHDPCYLGRHNGVYEEPRQVLASIPGLKLIELPDYRENSLCCGGGDGRIWMETRKGERFSDLRLEQAVEAGAEILATACPYCLLNFDNSLLTVDKADVIEIKGVSELVLEAI